MQPRTVINKNTGKYRTTNEIWESTGQLQKYRNLHEFTGPLGSLQQLLGQLSLSSRRGREIEYQLHLAGVRARMSADTRFSTKTGCI